MNAETQKEILVRRKEAAKMLTCSLRTIDRLASDGRLTRICIRKKGVRFRIGEIEAIINAK